MSDEKDPTTDAELAALKCSFCYTDQWIGGYPCKEFVMHEMADHVFQGGWRTCADCAILIECEDWIGLFNRNWPLVEAALQVPTVSPAHEKRKRELLYSRNDKFREHRDGAFQSIKEIELSAKAEMQRMLDRVADAVESNRMIIL